MLQIIIPAEERWDEEHEEFIVSKKEQKLMLEHSLVSLSKWESKWQVPFLSKKEKTYEETRLYKMHDNHTECKRRCVQALNI